MSKVKEILLWLIVFLVMIAIAEVALSVTVPDLLKGGEIQVTTRDGVIHKQSSEEYMMVNRRASELYHQRQQLYIDSLLLKIKILESKIWEEELFWSPFDEISWEDL